MKSLGSFHHGPTQMSNKTGLATIGPCLACTMTLWLQTVLVARQGWIDWMKNP
jgi:hypothetical protein